MALVWRVSTFHRLRSGSLLDWVVAEESLAGHGLCLLHNVLPSGPAYVGSCPIPVEIESPTVLAWASNFFLVYCWMSLPSAGLV